MLAPKLGEIAGGRILPARDELQAVMIDDLLIVLGIGRPQAFSIAAGSVDPVRSIRVGELEKSPQDPRDGSPAAAARLSNQS